MMGRFVALSLLVLASGCRKEPSPADSLPATPALGSASASPLANTAPPSASGAPLTGLDTCLVGSWKSTMFSLQVSQVTADGGANVTLQIKAGGDAAVDFRGMAPIRGKGAGADFDFQYSGKATAVLSTPTRGVISSSQADASALRVSANVSMPGAGKFPIFKNKAVSELAQMASAITAGKAVATPAPSELGVDTNPLFSTTHYTCEGDALTLSGDGPKWAFTRAR